MQTLSRLRLISAAFTLVCVSGFAQNRPPATPLVVHNPYFSIWSDTDLLTASPTRHWTGHPQPLNGLVRVDGKAFRFLGDAPRDVPAMQQTAHQVTPTHTRYTFAGAGITLELTFFTPALLDDLDVLSRPVTYISWSAQATDGAPHDVSLLFTASPEIATSYDGQAVVLSRHRTANSQVLSAGTRAQAVLNRSGDDLRIDWGYLHLAVPDNEASETALADAPAKGFSRTGHLSQTDAFDDPKPADHAAQLAVMLPLGKVESAPVTRHLLLSYTQGYAIQLLHANLRPW